MKTQKTYWKNCPPRPETPSDGEDSTAKATRDLRDKPARDRMVLENEERRTRGPRAGHKTYYNEVQKSSYIDYSFLYGLMERRSFCKRIPKRKYIKYHSRKRTS